MEGLSLFSLYQYAGGSGHEEVCRVLFDSPAASQAS